MSSYPTPPPTTSPKHAQDPSASFSFSQGQPAQETYYKDDTNSTKQPAQETYYKQTYSTPSSPKHQDFGSKPFQPSTYGTAPDFPPRRRSSPIQTTSVRPLAGAQYGYDSAAEQSGYPPQQRTFSPPPASRKPSKSNKARSQPATPQRSANNSPRLRSPKPIYYSPTNPIPSPYNASRPSPRPGFLKRMWARLQSWFTGFLNWARDNPVKAGLLSFLPVAAGVGLFKGVAALGKLVGGGKGAQGKKSRTWGEALTMGEDTRGKYGMDHFTKFAGTKSGPLDGGLKILNMLMDHWCKLTPSSIPRTASILLQLYFLEPWKHGK